MSNANILWERTDKMLEFDTEERERVYVLEGTDAAGNVYSAIGIYVCGQLESIEEVEDVTPIEYQKDR